MSSRFGGMLRERRRSLGLSIQQVANTIKIRPQIIEFFENGDFVFAFWTASAASRVCFRYHNGASISACGRKQPP